jgi:hypothetical protein
MSATGHDHDRLLKLERGENRAHASVSDDYLGF